jgi:hypothetical protein
MKAGASTNGMIAGFLMLNAHCLKQIFLATSANPAFFCGEGGANRDSRSAMAVRFNSIAPWRRNSLEK